MNPNKLSPKKKKTIFFIVLIILIIILVPAIKKHSERTKILKELRMQAYEDLKPQGEVMPTTIEGLREKAYEDLKPQG